MKLKNNQILNAFNAISTLDGIDKEIVIKDKEGNESFSILKVPFNLSGKVKWNIAKNLKKLKFHVETYNEFRDKQIKELSGGKNQIDDTDLENIEKFLSLMKEVDNQEVEIDGLLKFSQKDLGLDEENPEKTNQISNSVIAILMDNGFLE